jgi:hypothetical protein
LQLLLRSHSSPAMLCLVARAGAGAGQLGARGEQAQSESGVDALVVRWMLSSQLQTAPPASRAAPVTASSGGGGVQPRKSISSLTQQPGSAAACSSSGGSGHNGNAQSDAGSQSGHLVLVIPQCLELILHASVAAQLKATAAAVVR